MADALQQLGQRTAEAVGSVLAAFCGDQAELGSVAPVKIDVNPFAMVPEPAVLSHVAYVDGVTGGNMFAIGVAGARRLGAAMMGQDPAASASEEPLSELEMSAVGEAMNQMMATAAATVSDILGQEIDIDPPRTEVVDSLESAVGIQASSSHLLSASFTVCGAPARLVQIVPQAFLVRMRQALDERAEEAAAEQPAPLLEGAGGGVSADTLRRVRLRVWAEIGRARMSMSRAVAIQPGEIVELDRGADEPVDLYVNGRLFATGTLVRVDDADWAVRIESLTVNSTPSGGS
jgi:flagellar motor switch protein FliN/FliY